jgi:hypothetical protein
MYRIAVSRGAIEGSAMQLTIDGIAQDDATILLVDDGNQHSVELRLVS